jgi:ELWxxDGT repeat protein
MADNLIVIDLEGRLYTSDGTAGGTKPVSPISREYLGGIFGNGEIPTFAVLNGKVYFAGHDDSQSFGPTGLWSSNGTGAGTTEITGINNETSNGNLLGGSADITSAFGKVLFDGSNKAGLDSLWGSNGTAAGTAQVAGIVGAFSGGLFNGVAHPDFTSFDGSVLFEGRDTSGNYGLWVTSNGTAAGTHEISGISGADAKGIFAPVLAGQATPHFTVIAGGKLIFSGVDESGDTNLWVTRSPTAAPVELTGVNGAAVQGLIAGSGAPPDFTAFGDGAVFQGEAFAGTSVDSHGVVTNLEKDSLWFTDGSVKSTFEIPVPESQSTTPYGFNPIPSFAVLDGKLIFSADDSSDADSLWVLDGPTGTPVELTGINGAAFDLSPTDLTTDGSFVYFTGNDSNGDTGLWRTDGSVAGTVEIKVLTDSLSAEVTMSAVPLPPPPPTVSGVSSKPASGGIVGLGQTVKIDLNMGEAVTVTGAPTLMLSDGGVAKYNASGSNLANGVLEFDYTVASGQNTTDLKITGASVPTGSSVKSLAGVSANLAMTAAEETLRLTINGTPPKVAGVARAAPSSDVLSGGDVTITLTMSEAVTVTGAPVLRLSDGAIATYSSGSGTKSLVFTYQVAAESTTDLRVIGIGQSSGNMITDSAGNPLSSTLASDLKLGVNVFTFNHTTGGGDWNTGANWSPADAPVAGDTALITKSGTYTVTSNEDNSVYAVDTAAGATLAVGSGAVFTATGGTGTGANTGKFAVADGATLELGGPFVNSGSIALDGSANGAELEVEGAGLTLTGGGRVTLSDNSNNALAAAASGAALTNVNDMISGAGAIGAGANGLTIANQAKGVIDATGANNALIIEAGLTNAGALESTSARGLLIENVTVTNSGAVGAVAANSLVDLEGATITGGKISTVKGSILETTGGSSSTISGASIANAGTLGAEGGNLTINGGVANTGVLDANDGALTITGALTGAGKATIEGRGTIEFGPNDAKIAENVTFTNIGSGDALLKFDAAASTNPAFVYDGVISGFTAANDEIDLAGLAFEDDTTPTVKTSGGDTILTVTEGADKVSLTIAGTGHSFTISGDSGTGTLIIDPPSSSGADFSLPAHAFDLFGRTGWGLDAGTNDHFGRLALNDFLTPNPFHG